MPVKLRVLGGDRHLYPRSDLHVGPRIGHSVLQKSFPNIGGYRMHAAQVVFTTKSTTLATTTAKNYRMPDPLARFSTTWM